MRTPVDFVQKQIKSSGTATWQNYKTGVVWEFEVVEDGITMTSENATPEIREKRARWPHVLNQAQLSACIGWMYY